MSESQIAAFVGLPLTLTSLMPTQRGATLKLTDLEITDSDLAVLVASRNLRFVTRLDLSRNRITAAGMNAFRASPFTVNIAELDVSGNSLGDEGLQALLAGPALLSLQSLWLSDCGLTDRSFALLARQDNLQLVRLTLGSTRVDHPIWCNLVERYALGLQAIGAFNRPYQSALGAKRLRIVHEPHPGFRLGDHISESHRIPGRVPPPEVTSYFLYPLSDVVQLHWEKAMSGRHAGLESIKWLQQARAFEQKYLDSAVNTFVEQGNQPFNGLRSLRPIVAYCAGCDHTFDWSRMVTVEYSTHQGCGWGRSMVVCPAGHGLYSSCG